MELMVFGSGRLPQDLFRSESWKIPQNAQTKTYQACSFDEQDSINEWNYKFKLEQKHQKIKDYFYKGTSAGQIIQWEEVLPNQLVYEYC